MSCFSNQEFLDLNDLISSKILSFIIKKLKEGWKWGKEKKGDEKFLKSDLAFTKEDSSLIGRHFKVDIIGSWNDT